MIPMVFQEDQGTPLVSGLGDGEINSMEQNLKEPGPMDTGINVGNSKHALHLLQSLKHQWGFCLHST